jgi:hypothetical protein
MKGYIDKHRADKRDSAQAVCHIMNSSGNYKKPVTIADLIGKDPEKKKKPTQNNLKALKSRFGERKQ